VAFLALEDDSNTQSRIRTRTANKPAHPTAVTLQFEFGLYSPPWMAYSLAEEMKTLLLLAILLVQTAYAGTPTEALAAFKKSAQAKDFEATWKHAAKFDGLPDEVTEYLKGKVQRFIDLTSKGWDFEIIEEKLEDDCAVVVINESKKAGQKAFDLDPAYLIKQGDEWKVFPDVSDWDIAEQVAKDKVESFKKLEAWFKARKTEIKKEG
jgi:hypothetical protein